MFGKGFRQRLRQFGFPNWSARVVYAEKKSAPQGEGKTTDVSQDGASIVVDRDLGVGQTIKIRRVGANKEALARVVGCYQDHRSTGRVFGVALSDKESNLWDIVFPPAAGLGRCRAALPAAVRRLRTARGFLPE